MHAIAAKNEHKMMGKAGEHKREHKHRKSSGYQSESRRFSSSLKSNDKREGSSPLSFSLS